MQEKLEKQKVAQTFHRKITDRVESDTSVEVCKSQTVHNGTKGFLK